MFYLYGLVCLLLCATVGGQYSGSPAQSLETVFREGDGASVTLLPRGNLRTAEEEELTRSRSPDPSGDQSHGSQSRTRRQELLGLNLLPFDYTNPPKKLFENFHLTDVANHGATSTARVSTRASADRRRLHSSAGSEILAGVAGCAFLMVGGALAAWQVKHLAKVEEDAAAATRDASHAATADMRAVDLYHFDSRGSPGGGGGADDDNETADTAYTKVYSPTPNLHH